MESKEFENFIKKHVLINSVKNRPVLWDKTLDEYKEKAPKSAAWREICKILMEDYDELNKTEKLEFEKLVVKKWSQTRDAWIRTLHDKKRTKKSGNRPYRYHNQMLFLKKVVDAPIDDDIIIFEVKNASDRDDEIEQEMIQEEKNNSERISQRRTVKRKLSEDEKNISYTDHVDRHLSFFKSLLPSLALLDDDQTLDFHSGVIHLLQNVKSRVGQSAYDWSTPHAQTSSHSHYNQTHSYIGRPHPDSAQSPSPTHSQDSKLSEDPLYSHKYK